MKFTKKRYFTYQIIIINFQIFKISIFIVLQGKIPCLTNFMMILIFFFQCLVVKFTFKNLRHLYSN